MGDPFNFTECRTVATVFAAGSYSAESPGSIRFRDTQYHFAQNEGPCTGLSFGTFTACLRQKQRIQLQQSKMASRQNEIIISESVWWITSRGQNWGPFEYQWSSDLRGVEFLFRGEKYGEVCSQEEFFADLAPFRLPISVCRVAAIISGSVATSLSVVEEPDVRISRLIATLDEFGFGRFTIRRSAEAPDSAH